MANQPQIGVHLATLNLFRESDGSVQITVADARGAIDELEHADGRIGGLGEPANFRPVDYVEMLIIEAAGNMRQRQAVAVIRDPEQPDRVERVPLAEGLECADCNKAPVGWRCTRGAGHEGPCAAVER